MERWFPLTNRPIRTTIALTAVLLGVIVGAGALIRWHLLPQRMDDVLTQTAESDVPQQMDLVLRNTPAPYRKLATWLGSDRPIIALEASKRLHSQVDLWEQSPALQIGPQATELLVSLDAQWAGYSDKVRQDVHAVATRMANWNLGAVGSGEGTFLIAVERILSRSVGKPKETAPAASDALLTEYLQPDIEANPNRRDIEPIQHVNDVPLSSGLPWNPIELPNLPRPSSEVASQPAETTLPTDQLMPEALPANGKVRLNQPLKLPPLASSPRHLAPGAAPPPELPDLGKFTTLEIIWKLHAQAPRMVAHARDELASRRFTEADLELAARVSHPALAERLKLVRELPQLAREDRKTWLYYMTKDPDESVRYAAAAALITSSDPRLLRQLSADLATDPSPRIRQLIQR